MECAAPYCGKTFLIAVVWFAGVLKELGGRLDKKGRQFTCHFKVRLRELELLGDTVRACIHGVPITLSSRALPEKRGRRRHHILKTVTESLSRGKNTGGPEGGVKWNC